MRVFVYWNLHKKLWSIKALEGPDKGRVIARSSSVILTDAHGQVSEAGRQRVLREDRKNVHAGIVGDLVAVDGDAQTRWRTATTTSPYRARSPTTPASTPASCTPTTSPRSSCRMWCSSTTTAPCWLRHRGIVLADPGVVNIRRDRPVREREP